MQFIIQVFHLEKKYKIFKNKNNYNKLSFFLEKVIVIYGPGAWTLKKAQKCTLTVKRL